MEGHIAYFNQTNIYESVVNFEEYFIEMHFTNLHKVSIQQFKMNVRPFCLIHSGKHSFCYLNISPKYNLCLGFNSIFNHIKNCQLYLQHNQLECIKGRGSYRKVIWWFLCKLVKMLTRPDISENDPQRNKSKQKITEKCLICQVSKINAEIS